MLLNQLRLKSHNLQEIRLRFFGSHFNEGLNEQKRVLLKTKVQILILSFEHIDQTLSSLLELRFLLLIDRPGYGGRNQSQ